MQRRGQGEGERGEGMMGGDLDWNVHAYGNGDHDICPEDKEDVIEE